MSTLRVDNIKSRTGTTVTIPNSHNLTVDGNLSINGTFTGNVTGNCSGSAGSLASGATGADLTLSGDLTVNGTTTTVNSTTVTVDDKNIELGSVATPTDTTANGGGITLKGATDKSFTWNESAQNDYWQLTGGQLFLDEGLNTRKMLKEEVEISASDLTSVSNIDLEYGMVHYRSGNLGADIRPNIRYSSTRSVDNTMAVGESITITIIHAVNNTAHNVSGLEIDGNIVTVNWVGGSAPSDGGGSGVDIYTFNIIKTAANTYVVVGNQTKTS